ncbi:phosphonatase-like hydrolase [Salinispora arenicola]|uniref:Haloacid dehalogenase-like hydrolase n=1 Tax=Salinispora arenicola TaxID=168697 RepID=A0A542XRQ3_SALAC|nr:phosphonatase-like hydrolase [Salinispora arenicola]TQL38530.1 phosphonatase-like hydrolase [Salinispora arenicola]GIM84432.1 putative haloacid dehalogenase-like hydrolase [Salinispora arenicola]
MSARVGTTRLVCFDMAGTTVADDGLVAQAFTRALDEVGSTAIDRDAALRHVRDTMGESKIAVFRHLSGGDEAAARRLNGAFERAYALLVDAGLCAPIDGAEQLIARLRAAGVRTALTTGFSRATADRILSALGWRDLADLTLVPAEAGRGRPYPDLVLTALLRLGVDDVRHVTTVGDTASDVLAGRRAGAAIVAGVLTGAHDAATLRDAGATHVLHSVSDLETLLLPTHTPEE